MTRDSRQHDDPSVDLAINRVLGAEAAARDAIAECLRQADALLAQAEADARRIGERAERRIRNAHNTADAGIAGALKALRASAAPHAGIAAFGAERLEAVVARLAQELTEPAP